MVAGEEPDMCVRLRAKNWRIRRIAGEMVLHDAALTRFAQWWRRSRRAGLAYAMHMSRHGDASIPEWKGVMRRIMIWGAILPALVIIGIIFALFVYPYALLLSFGVLALYVFRYFRLVSRSLAQGDGWHYAACNAGLMTLDKFAQFIGAATFWFQKLMGKQTKLIEHK